MLFKRKEKSSDENNVYEVNHKEAFAALSEPDGRFNKGCFSFESGRAFYLNDRITINGTIVLTYECGPGDDSRRIRFTDEGLKFKDEILAALKKLIKEHKIFAENREKETLEGIEKSLKDYISS
jgi:hypothetical protein